MSPPWMPFYVADYLADTGHLNAAESGGYLHFMMHYWQHGGLPRDERQLARIARMTDREWAKNRDVIAAFFVEGWRHKRIERELAKADEKNTARVLAGKAGGYAKRRNSKANGNASSFAVASSSQSHLEDTSLRSVSAHVAPQKSRSIRSQIAEDAQPSEVDRDHATSVGMSAEVFLFEWARFRDHHLKVASSFASWPAAWRTWCANWIERRVMPSRMAPSHIARSPTVSELSHMDDPGHSFDDT